MCCFTRPVKRVSGPNIFARLSGTGEQVVVYSMHLSAAEDLAMVLPIPSDRRKGEKAVSFIDLSKYPEFFSALRNGFPQEYAAGIGAAPGATRGLGYKPLEVVTVG